MINYNKIKDILFSGNSFQHWKELEAFVPELKDCVGVEQSPIYHPEGSVDKHIAIVIDNCSSEKNITLSLVALFHDIGKAYTTVKKKLDDGTEKISSVGHEHSSAKIVEKYKELIEYLGANYEEVYQSVFHHMRTHLYVSGKMSREGKRKNFENEKYFNTLIKFAKSDTNKRI